MNDANTSTLPDELRLVAASELEPGERITWMEQPIPGLFARGILPLVMFGVVWTAACAIGEAVWIYFCFDKDTRWLGVIGAIGTTFGVVIGIGLLSSPYWMRRMARRSVYVLTDRRAILVRGGWLGDHTVRSFLPEQLTDIQRTQNADGSGDVVLARDVHRDSDGANQTTEVGFLAVRDAKAVEGRVRALVLASRE
jgi:hypothetical protein